MIVELQVLPSPSGTADVPSAHVEAAIAVSTAAGVRYAVGPVGPSVAGEPDEGWAVVRRAHEATLEAGADGVVSVIKVAQRVDRATTMASLTDKFR